MIDKNLIATQPSNPFNTTTKPAFTSLQEMNKEAQEMLSRKQEELDAYIATVDEAEEILEQLRQEIHQKNSELETLTATESNLANDSSFLEKEFADIDEKHKRVIASMQRKHEEEINTLKADFAQTLQEAEQWANRHSEIALQENINELNRLKEEAQTAKMHLNELTYTQSKSKTSRIVAEAQRKNTDQIAQLEAQISELTAITREEMRDARAKIDECVAAVEMRRQNHAAELRKLESEALQRSDRYSAHIQALKEQYELEKATLQQGVEAINTRAINTQNIINQLGKHHEAQLSAVNSDIETMKRTFSTPTSKVRSSLDSIKNSVRESQKMSVECNNIDGEVKMIENEINQLEDENKDLRRELKRLTSQLGGVNH